MNVFLLIAAVLSAVISCVAAGTLPHNNFNATGSNCGGNCPGGSCATCPCGTSSNYQNVANWCAQYSWNQAHCQCIANAESAGNANAVNQNSGGSYDIGLWQIINDKNWSQCSGGSAPCDVGTNLNCAIKVYNWGGGTWKLWSTCGKCGACDSA